MNRRSILLWSYRYDGIPLDFEDGLTFEQLYRTQRIDEISQSILQFAQDIKTHLAGLPAKDSAVQQSLALIHEQILWAAQHQKTVAVEVDLPDADATALLILKYLVELANPHRLVIFDENFPAVFKGHEIYPPESAQTWQEFWQQMAQAKAKAIDPTLQFIAKPEQAKVYLAPKMSEILAPYGFKPFDYNDPDFVHPKVDMLSRNHYSQEKIEQIKHEVYYETDVTDRQFGRVFGWCRDTNYGKQAIYVRLLTYHNEIKVLINTYIYIPEIYQIIKQFNFKHSYWGINIKYKNPTIEKGHFEISNTTAAQSFLNEFATSTVERMVNPFNNISSLVNIFPELVKGSPYYEQITSWDSRVILAWLNRSSEFDKLALISYTRYVPHVWD